MKYFFIFLIISSNTYASNPDYKIVPELKWEDNFCAYNNQMSSEAINYSFSFSSYQPILEKNKIFLNQLKATYPEINSYYSEGKLASILNENVDYWYELSEGERKSLKEFLYKNKMSDINKDWTNLENECLENLKTKTIIPQQQTDKN